MSRIGMTDHIIMSLSGMTDHMSLSGMTDYMSLSGMTDQLYNSCSYHLPLLVLTVNHGLGDVFQRCVVTL